MSLVLVAGVLLLSGSCVFALPIADSMYKAESNEENQVLNLDELQSLDNNFLLWNPPAVMPRTSLYDAVRDLEAAEQLKNDLREISDNDSGNLKEILYERKAQPKAGRFFIGKGRRQYKKRNNFSDCFWKYCV
ncbi:urotensin 2, alpha [Rhincodon typus]|uniref:urotensin 2, alpha n=1 Tax=Rhincodon typus TaxID=259920 RepID=UPI0009A3B5A8|nr:urotensin 2, alpha [Rhincodon typus]